MKVTRLLSFLCLGACFALYASSLAAGDEVTRDSYREAVEPICEKNARSNVRILKGVRAMVRRNELKRAASRLDRAADALKQTVTELRGVPQPSADEGRLEKWLEAVSVEASLFERTAAKLRAGNVRAALRLVSRLNSQANAANSLVIPFEFHYCKLDPSRFV